MVLVDLYFRSQHTWLTLWARGALIFAVDENDRVHGRNNFHPGQAVYNPIPYTHSPHPPTRQKPMTIDANVPVTRNGQRSSCCLMANAVLDGYSRSQKPCGPALSRRITFPRFNIPTKTENPWTFPNLGSFILFQLDKQQFARKLGVPEGSELFQRCLDLPAKQYVGLVSGSFRGESNSDEPEYSIAFLSKSLPPALEYTSKPDSFTVPIAPKEMSASGRRLLRPRSFPWTGCYQYTVLGTKVSLTYVHYSGTECRLDKLDFALFESYIFKDRVAMLNREWLHTSSIPEDERSVLEDMMLSDSTIPLPVVVWQELKAEQEYHDPREFVKDVSSFREFVKLELDMAKELGH